MVMFLYQKVKGKETSNLECVPMQSILSFVFSTTYFVLVFTQRNRAHIFIKVM